MENQWEIHGKIMGHSWEIHGKFMGKPWEIHGKFMGMGCSTALGEHKSNFTETYGYLWSVYLQLVKK